ncbi:hypothetical protein OP870_02770 [Limosilactobacillus reuteri]|uniref:hypothetical protein n=1 Tax=Limosilactobacillus reuteri TaxID=1598 RepID=UPI000C1B6DBF|nr:hypothetical protein [Limosilactobacillus reuteri]PIN31291.1 hypothetical protein CUC10_00390 [Limosilactobacillus reuteri]PUH36317.1 hypothetical protein DB324_00390 [Limosilactobacillus reuteri]PUH36516.1 hypothetical protein DB323_00245 [Limosilactobacillus reuteri]UZM90724.1 hypothetical protein OP870_02770 [Limosilactobacillus reuteri]WLC95343.1 hypothetical protein LDE72_07550 [Limosilactobacillus reuteri]
MEIKFNAHDRQRKELVTKLADYTHQEAEYQYTPTYAYQIGKYTVNKDGILTSPDEVPTNLLEYLEQQGFHPTEIIKLNLTYRRDEFTDQALDNLRHLIWAKGQLIKDALDIAALPLDVDDQQVTFNWFDQVDADDALAYQQFVDKLVQYAINHQRIMATPHEESNEKYAFRCFLLRLGFIGPKFKAQRKVLLRNLTGSAAFKNQEA